MFQDLEISINCLIMMDGDMRVRRFSFMVFFACCALQWPVIFAAFYGAGCTSLNAVCFTLIAFPLESDEGDETRQSLRT